MHQRAHTDNSTIYHCKKQIDITFSCVCPVIDHKLRQNAVKVAVDPQGDGQVDPQTMLTTF